MNNLDTFLSIFFSNLIFHESWSFKPLKENSNNSVALLVYSLALAYSYVVLILTFSDNVREKLLVKLLSTGDCMYGQIKSTVGSS